MTIGLLPSIQKDRNAKLFISVNVHHARNASLSISAYIGLVYTRFCNSE